MFLFPVVVVRIKKWYFLFPLLLLESSWKLLFWEIHHCWDSILRNGKDFVFHENLFKAGSSNLDG